MPLTKPVARFLDGIRAFLDDDAALVLEVESAPELRPQAARLLDAALDEQDTLAIPVGLSWEGIEPTCAAIDREVAAVVQQAQEGFEDEERLRFSLPAGPPAADPRWPTHVRTVEYLERVARALSSHVPRVVVVLAIEHTDAQQAEYVALLRALAVATGTPGLKWVAMVDAPMLGAGAGAVQGTDASARPTIERRRRRPYPADEARPGEGLERFALDPSWRVTTLRAPGGRAWVRQATATKRLGSTRTLAVHVEGLSFVDPQLYYTEAARSLARQCRDLELRTTGGQHVQPLYDELRELVVHVEAELHFAERCERLRAALMADDGELLVVLAPDEKFPAVQLAASVERLSHAAVSGRVRYFVVDPRLPEAFDVPPAWTVHRLRYHIGVEELEQGMKDRLQAPDCSLTERLRYLGALAGMAIAKEDPGTAMAYSLDALELSAQSDEPRERTAAWYGLGNTLYQCTAFEDAQDAYAECVDRALNEGNDLMAAQALTGLGHTWFMREDSEQAIGCYETARTMFAKLRQPQGEIYALTWHAEAAIRREDWKLAQIKFDEALKVCDGVDPAQAEAYRGARGELLMRKAKMYEQAGMRQQQQECAQQAEALGASPHVCDHP